LTWEFGRRGSRGRLSLGVVVVFESDQSKYQHSGFGRGLLVAGEQFVYVSYQQAAERARARMPASSDSTRTSRLLN
jgi:hypothetical protein